MLKPLIDNANVYLGTFGLRTQGVAQRVELDGNIYPCLYLAQGEPKPVNVEEPTLYHRVLSGPSRSIDEEGSPLHDDAVMTLAWSMRAVAVFPYNLYCVDDYALEDKVIRNVMQGLNLASTKAIATALNMSVVDYEAGDSNRGEDAWSAEFGTEYTGQVKIIYVDYRIEVQAFESCFTALGCDDEQINIIDVIIGEYCTDAPACEDATVTLNGVEFGTVAAGGTFPGEVEYANGTPVGSLVGDVWTIPNPTVCDPVTVNVNGTLYASPAAGATLGIPVVNSASTQIGTVNAGTNVVIANMTLDYPDATTQALVIVPGSTVTIPPHWTIQLTGTVASPFTVVSPAWDASFVCATQTLTGGTISGITINGAPSIATFVGASIPASATIVVTFASSLTQVVLTFS